MQKMTIEEKFRRRMRRISDGAIADLREYQWFHPPDLLEARHILAESVQLIDKKTAIGSLGSCFAREIKDYLQVNNYNYNYIEYGEGRLSGHGSAPWERVFNTGCIRQELERCMHGRTGRYTIGHDSRYYDLARKNAVFDTREDAENEGRYYVECAKAAVQESDIFIITLGLSEVWCDMANEEFMAEAPPASAYQSARHSCRLLSPDENIENLRCALQHLWSTNPALKVILTVSPVPLRATFFPRSALISNNVSKASLIYASHVICDEFDDVMYFPSYEITQGYLSQPFDWDGRHVTKDAVDVIMKLFMTKFGKTG